MSPRTMLGTTAAALLGLTVLPAGVASAHQGGDVPTNTRGLQVATEGEGKAMKFVANLQYKKGGEAQNGSDIEFMRVGKREFALAGTLAEGLQIINISDPRNPRRVAVYDCRVEQGDVQVWRNDGRILASYTADGSVGDAGAASRCGRDLDLDADDAGTVIVDLTNPREPSTVSFLPVAEGSHNMTIHPSGDYLYNSNSDLITGGTDPNIAIFDISNPRKPEHVQDFALPFTPTSLGSESHDVTFSRNGDRAYSAALSQTLVLDTSNPRKPRIVSNIIDPSINVSHQADPITLRRPNGKTRQLLVITDERAGAAASVECPGGGLHVYDITGKKERAPEKMGTWFIPAAQPQPGTTCTSHVLRMYPRQKMMTIAWYAQGVRVLDISGLATFQGSAAEVGYGEGVGMKEIGHYVMPDSDTWSFKTNKINRNGSFFGYGNDLVRGFDVYRFNGKPIGDVPPLRTRDLAKGTAGADRDIAWEGSAAVIVPTLLLAAALRRRARSVRSTAQEQPAG
jgi:hypothetical protein